MITHLKTAHFDETEFYCKCGKCKGKVRIPYEFMLNLKRLMDALEIARIPAGIPFVIDSGYRCKDHPESKKNPESAHTTAEACDIKATDSRSRFIIDRELSRAGFLRKGVSDSFIHCDVSRTLDQEVFWLYPK